MTTRSSHSLTSTNGRGNSLSGGINPRTLANWGPIAGGAALLLYGITRRSLGGLLLASAGAGLVYRGARSRPTTIKTGAAVTIAKPPEEVYRAWRNFEQLPRYMENLVSVREIDERRTHWAATTVGGDTVEWNAEIIDEEPNRRIAWRSVEDSEIDISGVIRFEPAPGDRGSEVHLSLEYTMPMGMLGAADLAMAGYEPSQQAGRDLNRFKQFLETGEIPTTEGQPHGPRGRAPAPETVTGALNNLLEGANVLRTGGRPTRGRAGTRA